MTLELLLVIGLILGAEFINGYTDAPNATATAVATGLLSRKHALWWAASTNFLGLLPSLIFGAAVANTIGKGIIDPHAINLDLVAAAMCGVIIWGRIASLIGLPVSKSHALFASLAGAAFVGGGTKALIASGWLKVLQGIGISIVLASSLSWLLGRGIMVIQRYKPMSDKHWRRLQLVTLSLVGAGHGWNDGLKFVGVFALALLLGGFTKEFTITPEIIMICAVVMGAGTLCGGWRIVDRIKKMTKNECKPWQGVTAELVSAMCIGASAFGGVPMSTTHTVVSSIAGAKGTTGFRGIDWKTVRLIVWGWVLTVIFCSLVTGMVTVIGWKIVAATYIVCELFIQWFENNTRKPVPETEGVLQF